MKIALAASPSSADILLLVLAKGEALGKSEKTALGSAMTKQVEARLKAKDFEGDEGQVLTLFTDDGKWKRVVLVGRGELGKEAPQMVEHLGAKLVDIARAAKAQSAAAVVKEADFQAIAYGAALSSYEFKRYKSADKKAVEMKELTFVTSVNKKTQETLGKVALFMKVSEVTRDMVNTCAGNLNTQDVANAAVAMAKKHKIKATVFDDKQLKKMGCGGLYAVGQGAHVGSRMVILEYRNKSKSKQANAAFVGKGITFDTGGLNIKPTGYIEDMKLDMTGAATVMAIMQGIAESKLQGYFVGVLCCAENAVSDRSIHPGDVVTIYNGKTVEINNTDAEGRMVLADGLSYTVKNFEPKVMVDIATLTGAVTVALGYHITGVMGNKQKLVDEYLECSQKTGERSWPFPLDEDFVKACKGTFSDLANATDGVRAGSIMGGAFLKHFVDDKTAWIHLDVAGSAWVEKPTPTTKYGATGVAIRSLIELAERHAG